jgi:hypothetical protein
VAIESGLKAEALEAINAYLTGARRGSEVAAWAKGFVIDHSYDDDRLLREALEMLWNLDHEDERWDTPRADLEYIRDCLIGKRQFIPPVVRETHA